MCELIETCFAPQRGGSRATPCRHPREREAVAGGGSLAGPQQPLLCLRERPAPRSSATRGNRDACSAHAALAGPPRRSLHGTMPRGSAASGTRTPTRVRLWDHSVSLLTCIFLPPSASHFEPQRIRIVGLEAVSGPEQSPLIHHQVPIGLGSSALPAHQEATCWEKLHHGALCGARLVSLPRLPPSWKTSVFCSLLGTSCARSLRRWGTAGRPSAGLCSVFQSTVSLSPQLSLF